LDVTVATARQDQRRLQRRTHRIVVIDWNQDRLHGDRGSSIAYEHASRTSDQPRDAKVSLTNPNPIAGSLQVRNEPRGSTATNKYDEFPLPHGLARRRGLHRV